MCDTFVAMPDTNRAEAVIFGKNSDRPAGEIQDVVTLPAQEHPTNSSLQCTYVTVPQVKTTLAVVLSKPRWMWGAEMGANEAGVVIGNEAVWTNQPTRESGLLGMDLLRLALERATSAREAVTVITSLLEIHGQGGNCAENFAFSYHNSFLIADPSDAWVLESAERVWVAERVTRGTRSISNGLTIRGIGDLHHSELNSDTDFAQQFSSGGVDEASSPYSRAGRVQLLCQQREGEFDLDSAKAILRDHEGGICMHGDFETTGSQISLLTMDQMEHWFIDGPNPCEQKYQQYQFIA